MSAQLDLFAHITGAYATAQDGRLTNEGLYQAVADRAGIASDDMNCRTPVGKAGAMRSLAKRKIRWFQQHLRQIGVIEHVPNERAVWQLTEAAGRKLNKIADGVTMIAFSTDLGVAIWGSNESFFPQFDGPIHLVLSSPPYPLARPRAYGNCSEADMVDFICRSLEPIVRQLAPGGSICLNVSNDCFLKNLPARSMYPERLVLAMWDRFGLFKMDQIIWNNTSKAPGPVQWASKKRIQLNVGWEPVYWFCNDPLKCKADNRNVLLPHSDRHSKLIARGGETRKANYSDGAYRIRPGSFGNDTPGAIPRNVLSKGHNCADSAALRRHARALSFPVHGAGFPSWLPEFFIKYLTSVGDLVVDPFAGGAKTMLAAERLGRRWAGTENILDYVRPSAELFRTSLGFSICPSFEAVRGDRSFA